MLQLEQVRQKDSDIPSSCRLRVFVHGPLEAWKREASGAWRLVDKDAWGKGRPARSVFKRLLVAPGRRLSRSSIQDDLWPDTENFELADKNVYNAINQIRRITGKDLVRTYETIYELADQSVIWADRDACESLLKEAENRGWTSREALPLLEQALLYLERGELLEGEGGTWVYGLRKKSEDMLRQCRSWLAASYEAQGKLWQAGEQYRAMILTDPSNENGLRLWLEMLARYGKRQEALKCHQEMKSFVEAQGFSLSDELEQMVASLNQQPTLALISPIHPLEDGTRNKPSAIAVVHHTMPWTEDLLRVYREGIIALYDLYLGGKPAHVEALLPLYAQQTASLVTPGSVLTQPAARVASLTQQLICELGMDRQDYGTALRAGQQALRYAEIADDRDLQVASLIKLGSLGYHRRDGMLARRSYEHAIALGNQDPARVTPLLRARCYSGVAQVYAMCDMPQEAYRAMGKAYESYPMQPEQDPAYPYLRASRFSLYVYGDCQARLFLGQPNEAAAALEALKREGNRDAAEEPITYLDLLSNYAEIQRQLDDLDAVTATLTEAAQLSRQLGSRLYFTKLAGTFHELRKKWSHESLVTSLDEVFQPW